MIEDVIHVYMEIYKEVEKLKPPSSFTTPHMISVTDTGCLNDIAEYVPRLNKILKQLDLDGEIMDAKYYLKWIRQHGDDYLALSYFMATLNIDYENARGIAQKTVLSELKRLIGTLPQSSHLELPLDELPAFQKLEPNPIKRFVQKIKRKRHGKGKNK